jgi:hypothetical protein
MKPGLHVALVASVCIALAACATSGSPSTYRLAVVALAEDPATRELFEDGLAAKLQANNYDAVASHTIIPAVTDFDDFGLASRLEEAGIQAIVMARPAEVGPGASIESVKGRISASDYENMRAFAGRISPAHDADDLVAVVHAGFYMIRDGRVELLSSGAVWLDEPVASREEGIDKLQDLIVANMNRARPAAREYLGLPPIGD